MGKTYSKPLAARRGRGTAWGRHGHGILCVNPPLMTNFNKLLISDEEEVLLNSLSRNFLKPPVICFLRSPNILQHLAH